MPKKKYHINLQETYIDDDTGEEIIVHELNHSVYGLIKYLEFENEERYYVECEALENYPILPNDWEEEIV